jgi:hypothetical protein
VSLTVTAISHPSLTFSGKAGTQEALMECLCSGFTAVKSFIVETALHLMLVAAGCEITEVENVFSVTLIVAELS